VVKHQREKQSVVMFRRRQLRRLHDPLRVCFSFAFRLAHPLLVSAVVHKLRGAIAVVDDLVRFGHCEKPPLLGCSHRQRVRTKTQIVNFIVCAAHIVKRIQVISNPAWVLRQVPF
jgi:hypothetical protein